MLRHCFAMALMMSVLYVWTPTTLINVFVPIRGLVYAATMGGSVAVLTLLLYVWGAHETRRDRELAAKL
jgi:hypothetical protein